MESMQGFVEGSIDGEKNFNGVVFPKTLFPSVAGTNLVVAVEEATAELSHLLQMHGAILFRGFHVDTAEEFSRVVSAFGWEEMSFAGIVLERLKKAERVFTVTEGPQDQTLYFHHEMALGKEFPSKIFFFCLQAPPEGGQTSILPSHLVVKKMEEKLPHVVEKFTKVGVLYHNKIPRFVNSDFPETLSKTWKWILEADNEIEAQRRVQEKQACSSIKFIDDQTAWCSYGPMIPVREFGGRRVWFNIIVSYTGNENDADFSFGDGSPLPPGTQEMYKSILEEICVDIVWQKGDVLLLDNLSVQHARRPGKPPRTVLISICK